GGHRASAMALQAIIEEQGRPWRLRLINLGEVLGHLDFLRRTTGVSVENFYNAMLRHNLTMAVGPMVPIMHKLIRLFHSREVERLARFWRQPRPALVVSLIPHFNRAIFEGLRAADAARDGVPTPMVTILTDLADYPPHFWIERQKQFFICGTAFSAQQVLAMGCPSERIFL